MKAATLIIFDTSILFGLHPDNPTFDLLRALKHSGHHKVGIPWMVQEELAAQRALAYSEAHKKAVSAIRALNKAAPWAVEPDPDEYDAEAARTFWREEYQEAFEIISTSGEAARLALYREANCEKPAKGMEVKDKGGAGDVAIWLSVVDYLKAHPQEQVCFVSSNTKDFGEGTSYPPTMADDIKGMEARLTHLSSFDAVVSEFTKPLDIDHEHIEGVLKGLLTSQEALTPIEAAAQELLTAGDFSLAGNEVQGIPSGLSPHLGYPPARWNSWVGAPTAVLRDVNNASGHEIGGEKWYTATVDWVLIGTAVRPFSSARLLNTTNQVACQWRTKLLFSTREGDTPTLLQHWPPETLNAGEMAEWEPLLLKGMKSVSSTNGVLGVLLASVLYAYASRHRLPDITLGDTVQG
jgi:hypothetical protein